MATAVLIGEQIEIPAISHGLSEFRRWATSDEFPEAGRIDFIAGRIEVDMSPEDLHTHGIPKTELVVVIGSRVRQRGLGELYTDRARVACPPTDLSVEPDIVFVSNEALDEGRVRLVPKSTGATDRYIELEGPPDLIVEIVSDSSVRKDTERLPERYCIAGVREYWLVDARGRDLIFHIHRHGESAYEPAPRDDELFQYSAVLDSWYRLDRTRNRHGRLQYTLQEKASA
ncbi:MAG: Uma2 family endonuclease [Planctomycetes bacterium]|nr:Uma2 family endonuclease [Planctomycetota bacterium]MBL7038191.1 Uma2 family endonuclease [Pirellulaceae bacterium]